MVKVSYGDARYILCKSDLNPDDSDHLIGIYDNHFIVNYWILDHTHKDAWQREHVWPNSKLGIPRVENHQKNIGSDLHNLRAIKPSTNGSRSNRYFDSGTGENHTVGSDAYYPGDDHKGDVARILFYMIVMYPELNLTDLLEHLVNDSTTNYRPEGAYMGKLSVLRQWHEEDPVNVFEMRRNNFIYSGIATTPEGNEITPQGNRNPFIDRPYYVERLFGSLTPSYVNPLTFKNLIYKPFSNTFIN